MPGLFPNLLANGASGIAVGMATNIPPHNAAEVIDAALVLLDNRAELAELLTHLRTGPDFPTGGVIVDSAETIAHAYETGRGEFSRPRALRPASRTARGRKTGIEKQAGGTWQLVISGIHLWRFQGQADRNVAQLIADKKLPILEDVRDESAGYHRAGAQEPHVIPTS